MGSSMCAAPVISGNPRTQDGEPATVALSAPGKRRRRRMAAAPSGVAAASR